MSITDQIIEQIVRLNEDQQRQVLAFAQQLGRPEGIPGTALIEWAERYPIAADDLDTMKRVIEEDCERIDGEWDNQPLSA